GVQKARHFLGCLALDAHGQTEGTDLQIGHRTVEHLAEQVGRLRARQRPRATRATTDVLDVLADPHGPPLWGIFDDFGLYANPGPGAGPHPVRATMSDSMAWPAKVGGGAVSWLGGRPKRPPICLPPKRIGRLRR